jgi:hypothetical protein
MWTKIGKQNRPIGGRDQVSDQRADGHLLARTNRQAGRAKRIKQARTIAPAAEHLLANAIG